MATIRVSGLAAVLADQDLLATVKDAADEAHAILAHAEQYALGDPHRLHWVDVARRTFINHFDGVEVELDRFTHRAIVDSLDEWEYENEG